MDKVGRPDIDAFEAVMERVVALGFHRLREINFGFSVLFVFSVAN